MLDLTADVVHARRVEPLQEQPAQPVAHVRQGQSRGHLLTPVSFTNQGSQALLEVNLWLATTDYLSNGYDSL